MVRVMADQEEKKQSNIEVFLKNNDAYLRYIFNSRFGRYYFSKRPKIKALYKKYLSEQDLRKKNRFCADILNAYEKTLLWQFRYRRDAFKQDQELSSLYSRERTVIDHSPQNHKDYYSVVIILKNEARYIREQILFYQATGADRIYLYDNDSTDDLLSVIDPFLKSGLVIYIKWPGKTVQHAAYRDAVRRTKNRSKWLAIIDSDEFLFPVHGTMPENLRKYEAYPGVGVNWIMYGPNGHVDSPDGLVMDNYTSTFADRDCMTNCHVKTISQPKKVVTVRHTHFPLYKRNRFAVDERGVTIDNYHSYMPQAGRAFSEINNRSVFRLNHYHSRSIEDLKRKCERGYADGAVNLPFEETLRSYDVPQIQDYAIKPFADIVREKMKG